MNTWMMSLRCFLIQSYCNKTQESKKFVEILLNKKLLITIKLKLVLLKYLSIIVQAVLSTASCSMLFLVNYISTATAKTYPATDCVSTTTCLT